MRDFGRIARALLLSSLAACGRAEQGTMEATASHAQRWTAAAPMKTARYLHGALALPSGKVLVFGGYEDGAASITTEIYDPPTNAWSAGGSAALPRHFTRLAPLSQGDTQVLVAGGEWSTLSNAETYDVVTGLWTLTQPMLETRAAHSLVALNDGRVLVVGGSLDNLATGLASHYELYQPASRTFVQGPSMAQPRSDAVAVRLSDGRVLVAGGESSVSTVPFSGAEIYDPGTNTAALVAPMHAARVRGQAALIGSKVLMVGGAVDSRADSTAEIYDPAADTWTTVESAPTPQAHACILTLPGGQVLLAGGENNVGPSSQAELFDPATKKWRALAPLAHARNEPACALLPSGAVLITGGFDVAASAPVVLSSTEILSPSELALDAGPDAQTDAAADAPTADTGRADAAAKPTLDGDAKSCKFPADCASGFCVEGVCCDAPCDAPCSSCAMPWSPGKCAPQPAGFDLKHRCGAANSCSSTCGAAGTCVPARAGDQCAPSQCLDRSHGVGAAICAAQGASCDTSARISFDCGAYACEAAFGACHDRCASSDECAGGYACDVTTGSCLTLAPSADGAGCSCADAGAGAGAGGVAGLGALSALAAVVARRRRRLAR